MALVIGANCCFYSGCSDGKVRDDSDHSETAKEGSRETTTVTSETETETEATTVTTTEETTETAPTPTPAPTLSDEAAVVLSDVVQRSYLNFLYRDASPEEADAIVSATRNDPESLSSTMRSLTEIRPWTKSASVVLSSNSILITAERPQWTISSQVKSGKAYGRATAWISTRSSLMYILTAP